MIPDALVYSMMVENDRVASMIEQTITEQNSILINSGHRMMVRKWKSVKY